MEKDMNNNVTCQAGQAFMGVDNEEAIDHPSKFSLLQGEDEAPVREELRQ